jgi:hypothetical protein
MPETESLGCGAQAVEAGAVEHGRRPRYELADVVRQFGSRYLARHPASREQRKVLRAIARCRTAALGGHVDACDSCGHRRQSYNSCRNRHCPKCQGRNRTRWVEGRLEDVLPIEYFHVVFTVPHALNELCRYNQRVVFNLLFRAASETLMAMGRARMGGELGVTAALHTWGQTMIEHHHLHCVVTGGALSADGERWVASRRGYLFSVFEVSATYRARFLRGLERAYGRGELRGADRLEALGDEGAWGRFVDGLREQKWVVYAKRPFAGPEQVVKYIGRYTHRVAMTNDRIVGIDEETVSFEYKDYRDGGRRKVMRLGGEEFLGRYLRHVLPKGFQRIRHYGLLAKGRRHRLEQCRRVLGAGGSRVEPDRGEGEASEGSEGSEAVERCEVCGVGRMVRVEEMVRNSGPPAGWERAA